MDFRERLHRAAERGRETRDAKAREESARAIDADECRRLHSSYRLELNDYIETCLRQLAESFPGFAYEAIVNDQGWGGAVRRDDLSLNAGRRENLFSRLQLTISPHNEFHVLEVRAKGAVRNKENFSRNHYQLLKDVDIHTFRNLIEQWTLDYAEHYAASDG
jgi:hypothetical protein